MVTQQVVLLSQTSGEDDQMSEQVNPPSLCKSGAQKYCNRT